MGTRYPKRLVKQLFRAHFGDTRTSEGAGLGKHRCVIISIRTEIQRSGLANNDT